jgi:murein DD-endopeptidase MepM/ murein hydrolase activator NlpD
LDHGRLRGAHRPGNEPDPIDLGNEPPLSAAGETPGFVDRRRVSVHWLSATILTGFCGAALMGGAVFASLDGETNFATMPERVALALRGAVNTVSDRLGVGKSDKLQAMMEPDVVRQVIRVSTVSHLGSREVVRVRPFVRVTGNLSLAATDISANIPPFNPQRMLAESASADTETADNVPAAEPDAAVSFVTRDLGPALAKAKIAAVVPVDEILARVREAANWMSSPTHTATTGMPSGMKLAYATEDNADRYGLGARIIPENVTLLPKTRRQTTGGNAWNERTITLKQGDTFDSVLGGLGATPQETKEIIDAFGPRGRDSLKEGEKLRVLLSPVPGTQRVQPVRIILESKDEVEAIVALSDLDKYVAVDSSNMDTDLAQAKEPPNDATGIGLYRSIYETGLRNHMPRSVIDSMVKLYSYEFDFQHKVQPGDSFEVLFTGEDGVPSAQDKPNVLFAALTVGDETKKFYRFQTPDDGVVDYYDEHGRSVKKFLVRKPVPVGMITSGFGMRRHPILGVVKMHTGVDWGAPSGTPIFAAGTGIVEKAQREGGYGKFVLLRHANGYETAYGHLSAFARGIEPGVHVRQGQVLGFVGTTGVSTGPHVHFEIRINDRFVDPMRIKLPRGRVLEGPVLAQFEKERQRLDNMMTRAPSRLAQATYAPIQ